MKPAVPLLRGPMAGQASPLLLHGLQRAVSVLRHKGRNIGWISLPESQPPSALCWEKSLWLG